MTPGAYTCRPLPPRHARLLFCKMRLVRIAAPQVVVGPPFELDEAAQRVGEEVVDAAGEPGDVDAGGLQLLAPGEGKKPPHQLGSLLGGMTGHRHDLLLVRVHLDAALDQPQAARSEEHTSELQSLMRISY